MGKNTIGRSTLLSDNSTNEIVTKSSEMLSSTGFDEDYIDYFNEGTADILDDYAELVGEGTEVEYSLKKKFTKIELKMLIPGDSYDPFESGNEAKSRKAEKLTSLNLNTGLPTVSYKYAAGKNRVSVSVPLSEKKNTFFTDPTFIAVVLGIVCGFICLQLPDDIRSFILDTLASPIKSTLLGVISGVMGPYIFISMATSIISMDSINELTNLGWKILKRFIVIILFTMVVTLFVSAFFFNSFGTTSMSFSPDQLVEMVLNVIPTNLVSPFVDNNTGQLVVLGVVLGAALLLLGDKVSGLNDILTQSDEWLVSVMNIVTKLTPAIPFFSLFTIIGDGEFSTIIKGWEFIAAVYIAFAIAVIVKAIKMSLVTRTSIIDFLDKIKGIIKVSFTTGSNASAMKQMYEVSEQGLGIDPDFTSFWIPMCSSLLGTKTTVYLITATLMTAEISGLALTNSFLFVLILVTLELSLANPGATSAWTIMFQTLGMSTDYVGLFSTYRLLTDNYCAAVTSAYAMMEQYEAAYKLDSLK